MIKSFCVIHVVILGMCIGLAEKWQQTLKFDDCTTIHNPNDNKDYILSWTHDDKYGKGLRLFEREGCKVRFEGYDSFHSLDKYKVCLKAITWNIQGSGLTLKYYSSDSLKRIYTRYSSETPEMEWCSESDELVDVQLSITSLSSGTIKLSIYAVKTRSERNYIEKKGSAGKMISFIIGSVLGGVFLSGIILGVTISIACYKRRKAQKYKNIRDQIISSTTGKTGMQPVTFLTGFQKNAFYSTSQLYEQQQMHIQDKNMKEDA